MVVHQLLHLPGNTYKLGFVVVMGRGGRGLSIHIQPGPLDEPVSLEVYFPSVADVGDFDRSWRRAHHCSCKCEAKGGGTRGSDSPGDAQKKGLLRSVVDHLRNKVGHLPTEILWDFPRKPHEDPPPLNMWQNSLYWTLTANLWGGYRFFLCLSLLVSLHWTTVEKYDIFF